MQFLLPLCGLLILLKLTVPGFLLPWWAVLAPGVLVIVLSMAFWYWFFSGRAFAPTKGLYRYRVEWKWKDEDDTKWIPFEQKGKPLICKYNTEAERIIRTKLAPNYVGMEFRYQTLGSRKQPFGSPTVVGV